MQKNNDKKYCSRLLLREMTAKKINDKNINDKKIMKKMMTKNIVVGCYLSGNECKKIMIKNIVVGCYLGKWSRLFGYQINF
jgi:hypothetical protein